MTYGSGGGWDDRDQGWAGYSYQEERRRGTSPAVLVAIALLVVLILALLGVFAYLLLRPGGVAGQGSSPAASTSSSQAPRAPVTETAWSTPPERETVTVTRPAPSRVVPPPAGYYPSGADSSGWTGNRQARCNAGDPAAMIGRTTDAMFSICVNPANGRYYYRGSSGGAGVEVDDPVVAGASATVTNNGVVYSIDPGEMVIYQGGQVLSRQPMVDFWAG